MNKLSLELIPNFNPEEQWNNKQKQNDKNKNKIIPYLKKLYNEFWSDGLFPPIIFMKSSDIGIDKNEDFFKNVFTLQFLKWAGCYTMNY